MCGIVAAVSRRNIVPVLLEGLRRLEYRGYDSCGVAVVTEGGLRRAVVARGRGIEGAGRVSAARSLDRHLTHALGDARRA